MVSLLISIVSSISAFAYTGNYLYFLLVGVGVYYLLRKESKAETLAMLNLVLIAAIGVLGKVRTYGPNVQASLSYISVGAGLSMVFDITKKWFGLVPMLTLTGVGIGYLASEKFGVAGFALGLLVLPVLLREIFLERKAEVEEK